MPFPSDSPQQRVWNATWLVERLTTLPPILVQLHAVPVNLRAAAGARQATAEPGRCHEQARATRARRHPFNVEPPLSTAMQAGFITPASLHYVRNHGPVPRLSWGAHRLAVGGLLARPATFTMDELLERFEEVTVTCTLTCAGNRRKEENMVAKSIGFNWCALAGPAPAAARAARPKESFTAGSCPQALEAVCLLLMSASLIRS